MSEPGAGPLSKPHPQDSDDNEAKCFCSNVICSVAWAIPKDLIEENPESFICPSPDSYDRNEDFIIGRLRARLDVWMHIGAPKFVSIRH